MAYEVKGHWRLHKGKPIWIKAYTRGAVETKVEEGQVVAAPSAADAANQAGADYRGKFPTSVEPIQDASGQQEIDPFNGQPLWRVRYGEETD